MTDFDHDHWREDVAAYMLGALEPEEATALERHAEGCEHCRSEMRWLTVAVQALPETVERVEPPRRLRERVMAEVREDAGKHARAAGERRRTDARLSQRASRWLRGLGSGPMGLRPVAGVAAALLVVAVVAGFAISGGIGGGEGGPSSFVSEQPSSGVTATVVRKGESGTLHLTSVHKLPNDRVLEAWVRRGEKIEPVRALFVPDRRGHASTMLGNIKGVDTVMVTTEPPGGSDAPTSTPIVTVPIPQ